MPASQAQNCKRSWTSSTWTSRASFSFHREDDGKGKPKNLPSLERKTLAQTFCHHGNRQSDQPSDKIFPYVNQYLLAFTRIYSHLLAFTRIYSHFKLIIIARTKFPRGFFAYRVESHLGSWYYSVFDTNLIVWRNWNTCQSVSPFQLSFHTLIFCFFVLIPSLCLLSASFFPLCFPLFN